MFYGVKYYLDMLGWFLFSKISLPLCACYQTRFECDSENSNFLVIHVLITVSRNVQHFNELNESSVVTRGFMIIAHDAM